MASKVEPFNLQEALKGKLIEDAHVDLIAVGTAQVMTIQLVFKDKTMLRIRATGSVDVVLLE